MKCYAQFATLTDIYFQKKSSLLCTSNQVPIHLWDAYNGKLSASYFAENNVNEIVSARSAQFTTNGSYILAGYEKFLCMFDVSRPGSNGSYICNLIN